jgi:uncharacterized protein YdgA (DUF945 family)
MKKLVIVIVVVIIALAGLPFVTGRVTEAAVRNRIATLNGDAPLVAELTAYERGWFTSTARVDVGLNPAWLARALANWPFAVDALPSGRLPVLVEITHGPLAIGDSVHLGLASLVARADPDAALAHALRDEFGMPYVFELRGHAGFGGSFEFDADMPPIDTGDGTREIDFSGLVMSGELDGRTVAATGRLELLSYRHPFAAVTLEGARLDANYLLRPGDVAVGNGLLNIEALVVSSLLLGTEPLFSAHGVMLRNVASLDDDEATLSFTLDYEADSVAAGADVELTETDLHVELANIDAAAYRDYRTIVERLSLTPDGGEKLLVGELSPVLERVLAGGPTLAVNPLRFLHNGEPFAANLSIDTDPGRLPAGTLDLTEPAQWLAVAAVRADAEISKELARGLAARLLRTQISAGTGTAIPPGELDMLADAQAGLVLTTLLGQGYLEDSGGDLYTTSLSLADSMLTVNGNPVPLALP